MWTLRAGRHPVETGKSFMASSTSSRSKKKTSSEKRPVALGSPRPDEVPAQPISWAEVSVGLWSRWQKGGLLGPWDKPKQLPMAWELPSDLRGRLWPWLRRLTCLESKRLAAKQIRSVQMGVREWVSDIPQRLSLLMSPRSAKEESLADRGEPQQTAARVLGLEAVAIAYLLPALGGQEHSRLVEQALAILLQLSDSAVVPGECPLTASLWQVELPLTLAAWLPGELFPGSLRQQALQQLKLQIEEWVDGNGLPGPVALPVFGSLLAGWTRIWALERRIPELAADTELRDRYRLALQGYLRLWRHDGTPLWSGGGTEGIAAGMVATWLRLGRDAEERTIAQCVCPTPVPLAEIGGPRLKESKLCDASDYTEWGKLAILRHRWKRKSDKLGVNFAGRQVQMELNNRRSWLSGGLETQVSWNDQPLPWGDSWEEICWQSDEDTVYLEIQHELPDDLGVVQRQFLLARKARLCLIADAVLLNENRPVEAADRLQHRWEFPLAAGVTWQPAPETREGWLVAGGERLSVLPVTLPEWRVAHARGALVASAQSLVMHTTLPARRLYQAVMIDLDNKRSTKPLSWRQLTVGEQLKPVSIDQAVGIRIHLHKQQYLVYRSLTPPASRSVLGQNIYSDFYLGQFHPDGTAQTMIMIESA
jgi:hypothetical protein